MGQGGPGQMPGGSSSSETVESTGATVITDTQTLEGGTYTTSNSDESAILVEDGGDLTLNDATVEIQHTMQAFKNYLLQLENMKQLTEPAT